MTDCLPSKLDELIAKNVRLREELYTLSEKHRKMHSPDTATTAAALLSPEPDPAIKPEAEDG